MTNQASIQALKGRSMLLKVDTTGLSPTVYQTVAGMRATQLKLNGNQVDITNKSSNGWQELLADAGVRKIDVTASGEYDATAGSPFNFLEKVALANTFIDAEITFGSGVVYTGTWAISDFTVDGPYDNAQTFSMTLTSHGPVIRSGN
jgi:TP901-1 family phage major tail protein